MASKTAKEEANDVTPLVGQDRRSDASNSARECIQSLKTRQFYVDAIRSCFAEFIGTTVYVFVGVSSITNFIGNDEPSLPAVALAFGFVFIGLSAAMQHVSGGHFNPALTLGVLIAGGINIVTAVLYFIAQLVGGIVGASFVLIYLSQLDDGHNQTGLYTTPSENQTKYLEGIATTISVTPGSAIFLEAVLTTIFVVTFVHTSMEKKLQASSPAICGLTLAATIISGYKLTGGSLNPARSFGPAVVCGSARVWRVQYVYWIGPLLGGAVAGLLYRLVFSSNALIKVYSKTI